MGISGSKSGGSVPHKAVFFGEIPFHKPAIEASNLVGTSNRSVPESWPLNLLNMVVFCSYASLPEPFDHPADDPRKLPRHSSGT